MAAGPLSRTAWDDWFVDGDRSAVFVGGNVLVLSELATAVLRYVEDETELASLADHLAEEFGVPEGGDVLGATSAMVDELVERGVLSVPGDPAAGSPEDP